MMTPNRWQEILDVFHSVVAKPEVERAAALDEACGPDAALRAEVEALVAADGAAGSFGKLPLANLRGATSRAGRCTRCGGELASDYGLSGQCPRCLLNLALGDSGVFDPLAPGGVVGERYQVLRSLGRGGMGEVVLAFDLKLRVEVALKALARDRIGHERARELLRREVRAAREVISPNVCRIFDLISADGDELVSMEYVDGATLSQILRQRGPLAVREAQELASQFLAGLEAIHRAGLVHRDVKPENIMITRAGRVVIMDFGLANAPSEGPQTLAGTPGYMSPEQQIGTGVDARSDVFAAAVVLAEMLTVGGENAGQARQTLWRAIRLDPPQIEQGPWTRVLQRALAADAAARYASARELARALEEATLRQPGFEQRHPYPGLAAFTADNAEYFFGREIEVEQTWKKLDDARLLALVGPSGAGKSSFLRAGLLQALPGTWAAILVTPGTQPLQSIARALASSFAGDGDAVQALVAFDEDSCVRLFQKLGERHEHVLLAVDQFEELFTLNQPDVQASVARLLGRLVIDGDVRVILSLRDDFLLRCQEHEDLRPIFADITPLGPLGASGLRRALVQPALACGYHFEDEALVEEMIAEVGGERGALPLLAFAASRLWEQRDRDRGLLTREAYREIGGVAGALARHAERTLERIGRSRTPIVREICRNLVTSEGTRAVREREDLLSVFAHGARARADAEDVLTMLVDARLLTSYEQVTGDGSTRRQVEIVHESLLAAWPQLVQWQVQDQEGAQIRDQLRQAADVWQERGRPDDLLWAGTVYRDFQIWRERYPGALSGKEEEFASAARRRAERGRRRRNVAAAVVAGAVLLVALVTLGLWRRSEGMRVQAVAEAQRAESGRLLALAEREIDRYPTAALAYVIKGLEVADSEAGRLLALRILHRSNIARVARVVDPARPLDVAGPTVAFSPSSKWLAWGGFQKAEMLGRDGRMSPIESSYQADARRFVDVAFPGRDDQLITSHLGDIRFLSVPGGKELRRVAGDRSVRTPSSYITPSQFLVAASAGDRQIIRAHDIESDQSRFVGDMPAPRVLDLSENAIVYAHDRSVYLRRFTQWSAPPTLVAESPNPVTTLALAPGDGSVAVADTTNEVRVWHTDGAARAPFRVLRSPGAVVGLWYEATGRRLAASSFENGHPRVSVFDLHAAWDSSPEIMQKGDTSTLGGVAFDPGGQWMATTHGLDIAFWPISGSRPQVLRTEPPGPSLSLFFSADGRHLYSLNFYNSSVIRFPLDGGDAVNVIDGSRVSWRMLSSSRTSGLAVLAAIGGRVSVADLATGSTRPLTHIPPRGLPAPPALSDDGRFVAVGMRGAPAADRLLYVWDLEMDAIRTFGPWMAGKEPAVVTSVAFAGRDRLIVGLDRVGTIEIGLATGQRRELISKPLDHLVVSPDHQFAIGALGGMDASAEQGRSPLFRVDLKTGLSEEIPSHGRKVSAVALDPTGTLVATGTFDGAIRIGASTGTDPHLILGQEGDGAIYSLSFSPDGRRLAVGGEGFATHIWPVPDLTKPSLHRRPHGELLSMLRSHTNLTAVADPSSPNGYRLDPGAFPGWAQLPE
jgi:WD40 repeat protein